MVFSRFIYRKGGQRIAVYSRRRRLSAARKMAALGMPASAISAALRMKPGVVAAICAAPKDSIWGELAGLVAEEMRRAA